MANGRVSYDEFGNMYIEGISVNVRDNSYKVSDSFKRAIKDIEIQFKNAAISEEEYYRNMERLRDTYLEKGTKEWWSYTNKIISYENKLVAEQEKALEKEKKMIEDVYSDIASAIYDTQEDILKEQEKFKKKLTDFTSTHSTVKQVFVGLGENGRDLVHYDTNLSDLEAQKDGLIEYYNLLLAVKERGEEHFGKEGFSEFFNVLRTYSVEDGKAILKELLKEKDEGFFGFVGDWKDIQVMADNFTKKVYADDTKKAMEESVSYMQETLRSFGLEVPENFFDSGVLSAEKFGEGFVSQMESVMSGIGEKFTELMLGLEHSGIRRLSDENTKSVFAPVYNFIGGSGTISEKLREAQAQATVDKLRGNR